MISEEVAGHVYPAGAQGCRPRWGSVQVHLLLVLLSHPLQQQIEVALKQVAHDVVHGLPSCRVLAVIILFHELRHPFSLELLNTLQGLVLALFLVDFGRGSRQLLRS